MPADVGGLDVGVVPVQKVNHGELAVRHSDLRRRVSRGEQTTESDSVGVRRLEVTMDGYPDLSKDSDREEYEKRATQAITRCVVP